MPDYRVQLDAYSGPMDLLLYLIRRDEIDIYDIPISRILDQYLSYVKVLQHLDPELVGEFLVLAATLMEIKSRLLLPKPPPEQAGDDMLDPRADLVRQLLAYRTFREAAIQLADKAELHAQRYPRPKLDVPGDEEVDLEDVQIWDLLTAFNKLLAAVGRAKATHDVKYDDTPITLHAADVMDRLEREGPTMPFEKIFEGRSRGEMVGLFLALLELIRQQRVRIQQDRTFGTIVVTLIDSTPITTCLDAKDTEMFADEADADVEQEPTEPADEIDDAPFEEVGEDTPHEALFAREEPDDEEDDDEFSRRIKAVDIADIDMGRSLSAHDNEPAEPGETSGSATATTDASAAGSGPRPPIPDQDGGEAP